VFDYGEFWYARRQAQNATDAVALAGAVALYLDSSTDLSNTGPAYMSVLTVASANNVRCDSGARSGSVPDPTCARIRTVIPRAAALDATAAGSDAEKGSSVMRPPFGAIGHGNYRRGLLLRRFPVLAFSSAAISAAFAFSRPSIFCCMLAMTARNCSMVPTALILS
jgi:Putative Flp pilus-assembly TadE/G-like